MSEDQDTGEYEAPAPQAGYMEDEPQMALVVIPSSGGDDPDAEQTLKISLVSREKLSDVMEMLLPALSTAAQKTDTLIDDMIVDVVWAIHKSEMARQWVADGINSGVPETALALDAMPNMVREEIFRKLPRERQEEFSADAMGRIVQLVIPLILRILTKFYG